eukprot:g51464.t1
MEFAKDYPVLCSCLLGAAGMLVGWKLKASCSPPPKSVDHCELHVATTAELATYKELLKPLGIKEILSFADGKYLGLGVAVPDLWLAALKSAPFTPVHIAFPACNRALVDTWYENALALGFLDNGPPGPRPEYHPAYYGAFVKDPVHGHNLEAVCHIPPLPFAYKGRPGRGAKHE